MPAYIFTFSGRLLNSQEKPAIHSVAILASGVGPAETELKTRYKYTSFHCACITLDEFRDLQQSGAIPTIVHPTPPELCCCGICESCKQRGGFEP